MSRFLVLLGETCVERIARSHQWADMNTLRTWVADDVSRPNAYWGQTEVEGRHLPLNELKEVPHPVTDGTDVTVIHAVGWDGEPACWCLVEAPSEAAIEAAWPAV